MYDIIISLCVCIRSCPQAVQRRSELAAGGGGGQASVSVDPVTLLCVLAFFGSVAVTVAGQWRRVKQEAAPRPASAM